MVSYAVERTKKEFWLESGFFLVSMEFRKFSLNVCISLMERNLNVISLPCNILCWKVKFPQKVSWFLISRVVLVSIFLHFSFHALKKISIATHLMKSKLVWTQPRMFPTRLAIMKYFTIQRVICIVTVLQEIINISCHHGNQKKYIKITFLPPQSNLLPTKSSCNRSGFCSFSISSNSRSSELVNFSMETGFCCCCGYWGRLFTDSFL